MNEISEDHAHKSQAIARAAGFVGAGAAAFLVDQSVLFMLTGVGWPPLRARALSIGLAVSTAWLFNRRVFGAHRAPKRAHEYALEFCHYCGAALAARSLDFLTFVLCLPLMRKAVAQAQLAGFPVAFGESGARAIAAGVGSIIGAVLAYFLFSKWVFRDQGRIPARNVADR